GIAGTVRDPVSGGAGETRKTREKHSASPHQWALRERGMGRRDRRERPPADVDQLVQHKALLAQEALDIAEQRLAAIKRNELSLALDHHGVGELAGPVAHDLELVTLHIDLDEVDDD